jgi:uncharacterized membrane protein (DUF485 family)
METMRPIMPADFPEFNQAARDPLISESGQPNFAAIRETAEFQIIRHRLLLFIIPMSALFLCWYMLYVLLAAYAHEFMSRPLLDKINIGLVLGLSQFVSTIAIMLLYLQFAKKRVDPHVDALRARVSAAQSDRAAELMANARDGGR